MKKLLLTILLTCMSTSVFAINYVLDTGAPKFGVGAQIGMYTPINNVNSYLVNHKRFNARVYSEYNFNSMLAVQSGYSYYSNFLRTNSFKFKKIDAKAMQGIDLLGVVQAPLSYKIDLYVKGGANYMLTPRPYNKFAAVAGVGADYNVNSKIAINAEVARSFERKIMPNIDIISVGMVYKFDI